MASTSPNDDCHLRGRCSPDNDQNKDNVQSQQTYQNAREYAQALRPWLDWYHQMNALQSFTMNAAQFQFQMQNFLHLSSCINPPPYSTSAPHISNLQGSVRPDPYASRRPPNFVNNRQTPAPVGVGANVNNAQNQQQETHEGAEGVRLKIPTFWKRVAAELIDFTFLFYIKMIISISLVSEFNLDFSFIYGEDIIEKFNDLDYDRAFAITFEVIALEIINRILITIFETLCLCRARARGRATGATPGKRLMGLKVVSCDSIQPLGNGHVLVAPAGTISVKNAFLRSVIKNFTIAFFLPACLTLFFFKHNRTAYDVLAHTVVVEEVRDAR